MINKTSPLLVFSIFLIIISSIKFVEVGSIGLARISNNFIWLLSTLFIGYSFLVISRRKQITYLKNYRLIIIGICLAFAPFIISDKEFFFEGYLLPVGLIAGLTILFSLFQHEELSRKPSLVLYIFIIIASIQIVHGLFQTVPSLLHNISRGEMLFDPAPLGTFSQKNLFASLMATTIIVSGWLYCTEEYPSSKNQPNTIANLLLTISSAAIFLLIFSNSRSGYVGTILPIFIFAPFLLKQYKLKFIKWILFSTIIFLLSTTILVYITEPVSKDFSNISARQGIYLTSLSLISESLFWGHGLGSFEHVFANKFPELYWQGALPQNSSAINMSHPHNELLLWGIEGGLFSMIGLIVIILAITSPFKKVTNIGFAKLALITPLFFHAMVELPFELSALHYILLILLIYYTISTNHKVTAEKKLYSFGNILGLGLTVPLSILFIVNITSLFQCYNYLTTSQNISYLDKIKLTWGWRNDFDTVYNSSLMNINISSNDSVLLSKYINWSHEIIHKSPRIENYKNLIVAYAQSKQYSEALKTLRIMEYRYPNHREDKWIKGFLNSINNN